MNDQNAITLATVCDNHFAVMLGALLKSVELNYKSAANVDFYIVDDGLTDHNRKQIKS